MKYIVEDFSTDFQFETQQNCPSHIIVVFYKCFKKLEH